jgi:DNA-binding transcriptional LysR family regulator
MELDQVRAFLAVARSGSISKAARELYRTQPAISIKIGALEAELGERLLERRARGVALTPAGEIVRRRGESLLAAVETLRTELEDLSARRAGHLSVGASDTVCLYLLPRILKRFAAAYPGIELRLVTQISRRVIELIQADEIDLGIVTLPVESDTLAWRKLYDDRFVVVFPRRQRFAGRRWLRPAELEGQPIIHLKPDTLTRAWIDRLLEPYGLRDQVRMEVSTIEVIKKLVEVGLGISILPELAIREEVERGQLGAAHLRGVDLSRGLGLVFRKGKYFSRALGAFVDQVVEIGDPGPTHRSNARPDAPHPARSAGSPK